MRTACWCCASSPRRPSSPTTRSPPRWPRPWPRPPLHVADWGTASPVTARTPRSTYRLQLTAEFDLFEAAKRLPYLHDLGVDWVYLSPLLAAEAGSEHGYDVAVHTREDPERGGSTGLDVLAAAARTLGMGVLVDIVPNHVGVASPRPATWWWDVLRARTRVPLRVVLRHRLGRRCRPAPRAGRGRRRRGRDRGGRRRARGALPRAPAADGAVDHDPRRAALRAGLVAARRRRAQLPAVLHGDHAGRDPGRGARGVRRVARRDQAVVRRRPGRRAAGRPPRRAARPR